MEIYFQTFYIHVYASHFLRMGLTFTRTLVFACHRMVEQTSIHEVLKNYGEQYKVPLEVCRIIHVRATLGMTLEVLNVDKRLWYFIEKLIPNVDRILKLVGLLA